MGIPVSYAGWCVVGCVTGVAGWASALAQAPCRCRLPSFPQRLAVRGDRALGAQHHGRQGIGHTEGRDFLFDILFWRLDTKRFNICLK